MFLDRTQILVLHARFYVSDWASKIARKYNCTSKKSGTVN